MNKWEKILQNQISNSEWTGYVTYYPHKKAYRNLDNFDMKKAWQGVDKLNLYVHIPFCANKCSYCNLFSTVLNDENRKQFYSAYVEKVLKEIDFYKDKINPNVKIMSIYFGGGTPTILTYGELKKIMNKFKEVFHNYDENIEPCIECYPINLSKKYLQKLYEIGFRRISVGVQSFETKELKIINRKYTLGKIENIRKWAKMARLNVNFDLIYGLPYQTKETFLSSLNKMILISPESICVYPLAIRQKTSISTLSSNLMMTMQDKYEVFPVVRKELEEAGYTLETIVRFIKSNKSTCQMEKYEYAGIETLGVGAGARSYANGVNYSITYKVQDKFVKAIIDGYMNSDPENRVLTGYFYEPFDFKIKYFMLNLLDAGANKKVYKEKFNANAEEDFKEQLEALFNLKLIELKNDDLYVLTYKGMQYCDLVANIFVSDKVQKLYDEYRAE